MCHVTYKHIRIRIRICSVSVRLVWSLLRLCSYIIQPIIYVGYCYHYHSYGPGHTEVDPSNDQINVSWHRLSSPFVVRKSIR